MKKTERIRGLAHSPMLAWNALVRGRYSFVYDQMPICIQNMSISKRINLFKAGLNLFRRRSNPWSMPLHMQIEPINYCNLRCPVCPTGAKSLKRPPNTMDLNLFKKAIDEVGPFLLTLSLWGWGESLLHPCFSEMLKAVHNHNIAVFVSTNGQNLNDPTIIEELLNFPPAHLIVAVDGLTDETHSEYRIGAKLAPILEGVKKIAGIKKQKRLKNPIVHMRFMVMRHNQHELPDVKKFALENGFDMVSMRTLSIADIPSLEDIHGKYLPDLPQFRAYEYDEKTRLHRKDFICMHPFWFPSIFSDGTVVVCDQDCNAQLPLGKMGDGRTFRNIWNSVQAESVRNIFLKNTEDRDFCTNCPACDRTTTDTSVSAIALKPEFHGPAIITRVKIDTPLP